MDAQTTNASSSAELAELRARYGALESIRQELGLTRRQICERLFVDPSAWSRWTAGGQDRAPLRAYKSLVMMLEQKRASCTVASGAAAIPGNETLRSSEPATRNEAVSLGWKFVLLLNTLAVIYLLVKLS